MIPEAAVEAAARVLFEADTDGGLIHPLAAYMEPARLALEAAASYMLRDSWIEGFNTGMEYGEWWAGPMTSPEPDNSNANPYRTAK